MAKKPVVKKEAPRTIEEMIIDLNDLKRSNAAGELVNPRAITSLRRQIARTKTQARLQEITKQKEDK